MEEMQIEYNKKLAFFIMLGTLIIGWICLGFISIIPIIGAIYFIFYYKNLIKFDWIKNSLTIFYLQKQGIKLYPYEEKIPWEDIDTFYIKFAFFRYYLCLKLRKNIVITDGKKLFYEKLQQANILNDAHQADKIIEYPYNFIKSSNSALKSKMEMFLNEYSPYYFEKSQDKLEINKNNSYILWAGLISVFITNMMAQNGVFFVFSCFVAGAIMFYLSKKLQYTAYLILTKKGFEFPEANLMLNWNVIKLIEVQQATRDTPGALIIWFNDIKTFMKDNPGFFSSSGNALDYDAEKLKKTGRYKVNCAETEGGADALREKFQIYMEKYGQGAIQGQEETKSDIKENQSTNIIEEKKEVIYENKTTVDTLQNLESELDLELQKLVEIQFKSQAAFNQMILLKEEGVYCLAVKVEELRPNGYCIFLKSQIEKISYCPGFYSEALQKEYYYKLNALPYIDLKTWDIILNSYQVKNHFVEIKTLKETYKGKLKEISQDKIVLNTSIIKDKVTFEAVSIDLSSVILISFETSELMLLEKYSS